MIIPRIFIIYSKGASVLIITKAAPEHPDA
jgi:hypothetical protein